MQMLSYLRLKNFVQIRYFVSHNIQLSMHKYIDQLNEAQREPVLQKRWANDHYCWCRLWKTRVLTIRIAYLMHQG
jgi:hypothetical protein